MSRPAVVCFWLAKWWVLDGLNCLPTLIRPSFAGGDTEKVQGHHQEGGEHSI
jgi:hypothetical protein